MNNPLMQEDQADEGVKSTLKSRVVDWLHLNDDHPLLPLSFIKYIPVFEKGDYSNCDLPTAATQLAGAAGAAGEIGGGTSSRWIVTIAVS